MKGAARSSIRLIFRSVALFGALAGCGSSRDSGFAAKPGEGALPDGGVPSSVFADASRSEPNTSCPAETQFIYLIDLTGTLYKFDPPSLTLTPIGPISCPSPGGVYSMAVDRNAFAWVLQATGQLVKVDTRNAKCQATAFQAQQDGFGLNFGMGFSSNAAGSAEETLYVSDATNPGLASIDTKSLKLTKIGAYDKASSRAELTGTGDARLFGAFEGTPYVVSEIAKQTANITSEAPQSSINYPPNSSNFAFAFWGGDFFLFVGPGDHTDVFRYRPADKTTAKVKTESIVVVGAGVSTCAPTAPK